MIKEKQVTTKIFDTELLKPGTKIICKYTSHYPFIDEYENYDEIIDAEVISCTEEKLIIKGIERDYLHEIIYTIDIDKVLKGFWVIKVID